MIKESSKICIQCKGYRRLCGLSRCPIVSSSIYRSKTVSLLVKGVVEGSTPPTLIVGETGYPNVRLYIGIPPGVKGDKASFYDNPSEWFGKLSLEDVINLRSCLVLNATPKLNVYAVPKTVDRDILFASISLKPVDAEAVVEKYIRRSLTLDPLLPPLGPSVLIKNIKVIGNPSIHRSLEKVVDDDLKASKAVLTLYKDGVDFYSIVRAFSLGLLGSLRSRKAVPTRWSITAIDQIIGNNLLSSVNLRPSISDVLVFYSEYMYNRYVVVLAPGPYKGLWIEVWHPSSVFNPGTRTEYLVVEEHPVGSYTYMDGGYLAARTSVAEYLYKIGRKAKVLILREILPQYVYTVGSWQIRLNVKHALEKGPILRNPSAGELKSFVVSRMSVPKEVVDKVLEFVYGYKQSKLDEFLLSS